MMPFLLSSFVVGVLAIGGFSVWLLQGVEENWKVRWVCLWCIYSVAAYGLLIGMLLILLR
jgi:hypothetical protein